MRDLHLPFLRSGVPSIIGYLIVTVTALTSIPLTLLSHNTESIITIIICTITGGVTLTLFRIIRSHSPALPFFVGSAIGASCAASFTTASSPWIAAAICAVGIIIVNSLPIASTRLRVSSFSVVSLILSINLLLTGSSEILISLSAITDRALSITQTPLSAVGSLSLSLPTGELSALFALLFAMIAIITGIIRSGEIVCAITGFAVIRLSAALLLHIPFAGYGDASLLALMIFSLSARAVDPSGRALSRSGRLSSAFFAGTFWEISFLCTGRLEIAAGSFIIADIYSCIADQPILRSKIRKLSM